VRVRHFGVIYHFHLQGRRKRKKSPGINLPHEFAAFFLVILIYINYGSEMCLRNFGHSLSYRALQIRRPYSSKHSGLSSVHATSTASKS
jgi:hypothetical protein